MEKTIVVSKDGIEFVYDSDGISELLLKLFGGEVECIPINYSDKNGWYFTFNGRVYRGYVSREAAKIALTTILEAFMKGEVNEG